MICKLFWSLRQVNVTFTFLRISVDMAAGSLWACAWDKLLAVTSAVFSRTPVCVCVAKAPYWLVMLECPCREWWGFERQWGRNGREGVNAERWRDGGCLKNGGRRLRSNPINRGNCAERILERGGGGRGWVRKGGGRKRYTGCTSVPKKKRKTFR